MRAMHLLRAIALTCIMCVLNVSAENPTPWLHVYRNSPDFFSAPLSGVNAINHRVSDADGPVMRIATGPDSVDIPIADVEHFVIGTNVPTIYIEIPDYPDMQDLVDKDTYLDAIITIDGMGQFDDLPPTQVSVKGRGNTTWSFPKKPYRLKFPKKTQLLGLPKGKSYALIANYIDCSQMRNAVAYQTARLLGMPYTNHTQPIRVYFNGILKGSYFITEKIGISSQSVDIDEAKGILFELDSNYDEKYCFRSPIYNLPVMVKDPDLDELAQTQGVSAESILNAWQNDFIDFEYKVYHHELVDMVDYDMASLVDYLIVYNLCGNRELTWPSSTYVHKLSIDSPYEFGPVWDFDWAFTYNNGYEDKVPDQQLLAPWKPLLGQPFFKCLCSNDDFMQAYRSRWQYFCNELLPQLYLFIDEYASVIAPSAIENGLLWPSNPGVTTSTFDFANNVANLKQWIEARVEYISSHPHCGLYD